MSPNARNKAKELIDRSRTQLKEIAKVTQTIESERYVDMQGHKGNFRNKGANIFIKKIFTIYNSVSFGDVLDEGQDYVDVSQ